MKWFRQNQFLAGFLGAAGIATLLTICFLLYQKRWADAATARLQSEVAELNRLRLSAPFPSETNLHRARIQAESYRISLRGLEGELKERMLPTLPMRPNEFQAELRLKVEGTRERAARAKVQLPANFHLGFDEYASSLPGDEAAPFLGRQLRAIEWIISKAIEAHIDSLGKLTRTPLPEEKQIEPKINEAKAGSVLLSKMIPKQVVDYSAIDLAFSGSQSAARRLINQIAGCKQQLYVVRALLVRNQADKGPKRGGTETVAPSAIPVSQQPSAPAGEEKKQEAAIAFLVGNEHLDLTARIEIVNFAWPEGKSR